MAKIREQVEKSGAKLVKMGRNWELKLKNQEEKEVDPNEFLSGTSANPTLPCAGYATVQTPVTPPSKLDTYLIAK